MIKKKILISGLIILIIGFLVFDYFVIKYIRDKEKTKTSSNNSVSQMAEKNFDIDVKVTDDIVETKNDVQEESKQENAEETENKENVEETRTIENVKTSNVENNKTKTESQPVTQPKQETKVENKTTSIAKTNTQNNNVNNQTSTNTKQNTQSVNTQVQAQKQEQQVQQTPQVTQQPQVKQEEQKPVQEVVPAQPTREVRRNDAMIQKIKTYISTHETERMKKYGYSFVVDSSVTKMTHPFTYSEYNMQTCLDMTGQIYVYAQDYYVNGQYVETQCYVY